MNTLHIATGGLFLIAAAHKLWKRQAEHFFTRFICFLWYMLTMGSDPTRIDGDYVVLLIPLIEIVSPIFRRYWQRKER